jgi:hypothetical protein
MEERRIQNSRSDSRSPSFFVLTSLLFGHRVETLSLLILKDKCSRNRLRWIPFSRTGAISCTSSGEGREEGIRAKNTLYKNPAGHEESEL